MLKALLLDVDGVLASGWPFSPRLERDYGIPVSTSASFFRAEPFRACLTGRVDLKEEIALHLPRWGWSGSLEEFLHYWFSSVDVLNEELLAYVQQLRQAGLPCYLATNQEQYRIAHFLERHHFAELFDGIFFSGAIGCLKEDRAFFQHVLQTLAGVQAEEMLFWDDLVVNVETARKAGIRAELYTDFPTFERSMRAYVQHLLPTP